jgi:hypothetical protein
MTIDPNAAIDFLIRESANFAKAKAERIYLEEWRKSKKALLMQQSRENTSAGQERDAYAHPEYAALLEGLKAAVEIEETLKFKLIAAQARVEVWRSQEASNRAVDRSAR